MPEEKSVNSKGQFCLCLRGCPALVMFYQGSPSAGGLRLRTGFSNGQRKTLARATAEAERSKTALAVPSAFPIQHSLPAQLISPPAQTAPSPSSSRRSCRKSHHSHWQPNLLFPPHIYTWQSSSCFPYKEWLCHPAALGSPSLRDAVAAAQQSHTGCTAGTVNTFGTTIFK